MASAKHNDAPAQFNRRALLKSAPAVAGLMAVGAAPAVAQGETPVAALFREWRAAQALCDAASNDEYAAAHDHRWGIEQKLVAETSQNLRDVMLKLMAWSSYGEGEIEGESPWLVQTWAEARALVKVQAATSG